MRSMKMFVLLPLAVIAGTFSTQAFTQTDSNSRVTVESIDLLGVRSDGIQLLVHSRISSARKITVKRVEFEQMNVNGIPLRLEPIVQPLLINPNQEMDLAPIEVTVKTQDLKSVEPLISAISRGRAELRGKAHVELDLNFLERLFSGHPSGKADIAIQGDIPFDVPGGEGGRAAMILALRAFQLLL